MESFDESGNKKSAKNGSHQEKRACPNIQELSKIVSQVQMMSDSLAACSQMSKYRPLRKMGKISDQRSIQHTPTPESSIQILLSAEERTLDGSQSDGGESLIASYINKKGKKTHRRNFGSRDELIGKSSSDEALLKILAGRFGRELNSNSDEFPESKKEGTAVRMYKPESVIPERMIDIIQRELKFLMKLSPSLTYLLVIMSDTMFHYKGCSKCRNKLRPAFSWILYRLQKLIKFIVTKRQGTYIWPNDLSYLRIVPVDRKDGFEIEKFYSLSNGPNSSLPDEQKRQLLKVDRLVGSGNLPGGGPSIKSKPLQKNKSFLQRILLNNENDSRRRFPIVQPQQSSDKPIVVVLRSSTEPKVCLDEKRVVLSPKLISDRAFWKLKLPSQVHELIFSPVSWGRVQKYKKDRVRKKFIPLRKLKFVQQGGHPANKTNVRASYFTKNILINFSELIFDFMTDGVEEKMHMQKVRELEAELKELKVLMLEVRRNQAELSKVLLKKGICSLPLIKFTNPEILQEEDWVLSKISEIRLHETRISSLDALLETLDDLKRKCNLKNRLLLTLLKGFESNVPKEWWNEITNLMFGESIQEGLSAERVSSLIRKTSYFLRNGEQASSTILPLSRYEEKPSKEEPILKGKMGADVQDNLKILSDLDDKWASITDLSLPQFPMNIFTYPAVVQESLSSTVRKLEYHVSVLNIENERLWHEILDLRDDLNSSVKKLGQKMPQSSPEKLFPPAIKQSGKTINITIQLGSDKDRRGVSKTVKVNDKSNRTSIASTKPTIDSFSLLKDKFDYEDQKFAVLETGSKLSSRSERRQSRNDLNYLEDFPASPNVQRLRQNEEKIKAILRGRQSNPSIEQVIVGNSQVSEERLWKTIQQVPSMHVVNEATTSYLAGSSRRRPEVEDNLQSPSVMELTEGQSDGVLMSISNERELHPIPEDADDLDPRSSGSINEAIQHLRGRVRSIHKDVKVLKSKNDRIDKVLSKLVDDIKSSNESFEEIQRALFLKK